jgi:hypothetical protein
MANKSNNKPVEEPQPQPVEASLQQQYDALLTEHQALLDAHNELKEKYNQLFEAPAPAPAKETPGVPADTFEVDGQTYRMAIPKMKVGGIGERTALEILLDEETYPALGGKTIKEYLVSYGSIAVQKV